MTSSEIREKFLQYFKSKGHTIVPSSGLLPQGDATLLFTNAGMIQFKNVFLGDEKRDYTTAATCQKCLRAGGKHNDLENVGRTPRHHTFFEMLGNFSFGDYFKAEAIDYCWEFLTKEMGLPKDKLYATVFTDDDEAAKLWAERTDIDKDKIIRLGEEDNFWSMGDTGPCGPCSEILIDQGEALSCGRESCAPGCDCDRYLEIWNLVFMEFDRDKTGKLTKLPKPSIDTGMGLERLTAVSQGKTSNYDTDIFQPLIKEIEKIAPVTYGQNKETDVSIKAVADHSRAISFMIADGILPSNEGRGYVLRRILRRAARHGRFLGIKEAFLHLTTDKVISELSDIYPELKNSRETILKVALGEEERFIDTLEQGLTMLEEELKRLESKKIKTISGEFAFKLYDTYGFPLDLTEDIIRSKDITVDKVSFDKSMAEQKKAARGAWKGSGEEGSDELYKKLSTEGEKTEFVGYDKPTCTSTVRVIIKDGKVVPRADIGDEIEIITEQTPFYGESGGQVGDSGIIKSKVFEFKVTETLKPVEGLFTHKGKLIKGHVIKGNQVWLVPDVNKKSAIKRNHSATHLLHSALRKVLGDHVRQAGSLVTADSIRFDFNHFEQVSNEKITEIEKLVNKAVISNIEIQTEELSYKEAIKKGALAFFGDKYGEVVRTVAMGDVSTELCGGTHTGRTGNIGLIKIIKESSVASGVRRIEAVTGIKALEYLQNIDQMAGAASLACSSTLSELPQKIAKLMEDKKELEKEIKKLRGKSKSSDADSFLDNVKEINGIKVLSQVISADNGGELRDLVDLLRGKLKSGIVVLGAGTEDKAYIIVGITKDLVDKYNANDIIKEISPIIGGSGGGRRDMAQAGGKDVDKLNEAINKAFDAVKHLSGKQ